MRRATKRLEDAAIAAKRRRRRGRLSPTQRRALALLKLYSWTWLSNRTERRPGLSKPYVSHRTADVLTDLGLARQGNRNGYGYVAITAKGRRS